MSRIGLLAFIVLCLGTADLASQDGGFLPRKSLVVLTDDNYPPYVFKAADGALQGIIPDQWRLWSQETGVPVRLEGDDWGAALERMAAGEADVLETAFQTPERQRIWDFTAPYATIRVPVYVSSKVSGIKGLDTLEGFVVGVKDGDACIETLLAAGVTGLKRYPGYEEIIKDAAEGNIHVFCVDEPPALYFIHKFGLTRDFKEAFALESGQFHRAVRKGDSGTLKLVESGFARIDRARYREIDRKWMGTRLADSAAARILRTVSIVVLAGALALAGLIVYLRLIIRRKTAELENAVARLEESEAASKALLDANPDILFILDGNGVISYVKNAPDMPLYAEPSSFLGKSVEETLPAALAGRTMAVLGRVIEEGVQEVMEYVLEIGGAPRSYEARISPMGGKRALAIIRDITERKGMEEEAIRTHKLESIGVFAGGIAHDFNNILTAIEGNIALAKAGMDQGGAPYSFLANAERAADRAGTLTSQLLAFAKGGAPVRTGIPLAAVVRDAAAFALSGSPCALKAEFGDEPFYALADRNQMAQVVQNIVANACQAMPDGGTVRIGMSKARLSGGNHLGLSFGDYVVVEISDTGPGIPEEDQKRIFDPYFSTKPGKPGLGLSICHSIMKHHGGAIALSSKPGEGAAFSVYVPAARADYGAGEPSVPEPRKEGYGSARALVMDDEESIRDFLSELLKDMGIAHDTAENGERGIELFGKAAEEGRPYSIVFADLTIAGGMGGKDMMSALRKSGTPFKSVVISGYSTDPIMADYRAYGFDACLVKPFKIADFKRTVDSLQGGR